MCINLSGRYRAIYFLCLWGTLCIPAPAEAQLREPAWSLSVQATYGNRFMVYKGNFSDRYKDSLGKADRGRDAIGGAFTVSFQAGKRQRLYTGLQFHNFGFTRKKENLRFLDTIHPGIGIVNDLSQTGGAYVDFNYRYMYLSLPLLFSWQLSGKKLPNTSIHLIYGLSVSALVHHDIRAVLHGFSTRGGQKIYPLNNSSGEPERINAILQGGFRIENALYGKETMVFVQPELFVPAMTANRSSERHRLWAAAIQIGICYKPQSKTSK